MTQPVCIGIVRAVRRAVPLFAALVVLLLPALPARADQQIQASKTVSPYSPCSWGWAQLIRHDTATANWNVGIVPDAIVSAFESCQSIPWKYKTMAPYHLGIYLELYYVGLTGGTPMLCRNIGWFTNGPIPAHTLEVTGPAWGQEPCGLGFYRLDSRITVTVGELDQPWMDGTVSTGYIVD